MHTMRGPLISGGAATPWQFTYSFAVCISGSYLVDAKYRPTVALSEVSSRDKYTSINLVTGFSFPDNCPEGWGGANLGPRPGNWGTGRGARGELGHGAWAPGPYPTVGGSWGGGTPTHPEKRLGLRCGHQCEVTAIPCRPMQHLVEEVRDDRLLRRYGEFLPRVVEVLVQDCEQDLALALAQACYRPNAKG